MVPLLVPLPLTLTTVTLGSVGGTGNDGGSIDTSFTGGFQSAGDHSPTLVEQSIGAGGGFELVSGDDAPQITLGGSAGAQGDGGDITIVNDGTILTKATARTAPSCRRSAAAAARCSATSPTPG